jgi:hypothetical protein
VDATSRPAPQAEAPTSTANNRITTCAWNVIVRTECEIQRDRQESHLLIDRGILLSTMDLRLTVSAERGRARPVRNAIARSR